MNSKNLTPLEKTWMAFVKSLPCGVCGMSGPSEAHHIIQGLHFLTIPLCKDDHSGGFNGIHGEARIWKVKKLTEWIVLNNTIKAFVKMMKEKDITNILNAG